MSWFTMKDQPSRRKRKGIWLRWDSTLMEDVRKAIKRTKLMRPSETIERVVVHELRPDNKVMLEVWCVSLIDCVREKHRYNVFHVIMDENPDWICHGDLGRGLI